MQNEKEFKEAAGYEPNSPSQNETVEFGFRFWVSFPRREHHADDLPKYRPRMWQERIRPEIRNATLFNVLMILVLLIGIGITAHMAFQGITVAPPNHHSQPAMSPQEYAYLDAYRGLTYMSINQTLYMSPRSLYITPDGKGWLDTDGATISHPILPNSTLLEVTLTSDAGYVISNWSHGRQWWIHAIDKSKYSNRSGTVWVEEAHNPKRWYYASVPSYPVVVHMRDGLHSRTYTNEEIKKQVYS